MGLRLPCRSSLLLCASALMSLLALNGCQSFLDSRYAKSVHPDQGTVRIQGLAKPVTVRRNTLGMPLIEASSSHDAFFSLGYLHAADRISQMVSMRMLAEGRLAEVHGAGLLDVDRFMRTINLRASADSMYANASPRIKQLFEVYARGVNAYLFRYRDNLPMDLDASGHTPRYWKPEDSALLFCLLNFGLSGNLQEEIAALHLNDKVSAEKLAWLLPTYPDEPLPFEEAQKLEGLAVKGKIAGLSALQAATQQVAQLNMLGIAASNNWAIAPQNSLSGKTLLANDTHLPLSLPSVWSFVHIRSPQFQAAGVSIAGVPAVVAGFNGKLAWGMTMVMGDNQDLFLEQLENRAGKLYYKADGQWQAAHERHETFFIKGARATRESIWETRNGPLLNSALQNRQSPLQPMPLTSGYGLALRTIQSETDQTIDAFFDLSRAQSVNDAFRASQNIRAIALNLVFADAQHIGWQVTGRYPNRLQGTGLVPSPGWDNDYAWDGYADPMLHPYDQDPAQGWLGTANNRTVPRGYGMQLSNSWFAPDRAERLAQLAAAKNHDSRSMKAMQYDQVTPFAGKLQMMLDAPGMRTALAQAIQKLPQTDQTKASQALQRLMNFDGNMTASSADAALYSVFLQESAKATFLDELGPQESPAWQALVEIANNSYSAQADHLLGRDDSPFWDDVNTPVQEDKAATLARSLANTMSYLEAQLGSDPRTWQWGQLHRYHWQSDASKMAAHLGSSQQRSIKAISPYLDRGPYPAGGDHSTLNVAAYAWGENFDTWLIPAMRIIVDFGLEEPMLGLNSSGQSGNPASRHYADGIDAWRQGQYQSFPMQSHNLDKAYGHKRLTLMP